MTKAFFDDVADALAGFLPQTLRSFEWRTGSSNLKVWYPGSEREHYEVQLIGRRVLRAAGIAADAPALEVGFHAEHPERERNERAVDVLRAGERTWRRHLGREPEVAVFVGRASAWMRVSELWHGADALDDGTAVEAADRLAAYITRFEGVRRGPELRGARPKPGSR